MPAPPTARDHPLVLLVGSLCFYFFLLQLAWHGGPDGGCVALFVECFLNGALGQGEDCESVLHAISPLRALRWLGWRGVGVTVDALALAQVVPGSVFPVIGVAKGQRGVPYAAAQGFCLARGRHGCVAVVNHA